MELKDVPDVKVATANDGKYLVALVADNSGNEKVVVRTADYGVNHKQIAADLEKEIAGSFTVRRYLGGGKIWINAEDKSIFLFDGSGDFGIDENRQRTVEIVHGAFPYNTVSEL
ncbi:MAG: hypothetical protein WCF77_01410 [Minisyncoccia bacterium]|jgi:hypothetical protein